MNQIGDNKPTIDFAAEETARLEQDYGYLDVSIEELKAEVAAIQFPIEDDGTKGLVMSLIKRVRDHAKAISGLHEIEKTPHLRRGQAADQFFFRRVEALQKRNRRDKDGVGDLLGTELTAYDSRKLAEEQERRRQEAERLRKEAEAKAAAEAKARAEAEAARLSAERARLEATRTAKGAAAEAAAMEAATLAAERTAAAEKAEEAYISTLAKPADIMRTRGEDGTLGTMGREPYALIVDADLLDAKALWPFINLDAKEKALRAWAKAQGHRTQMAGASIGFKNRSTVR